MGSIHALGYVALRGLRGMGQAPLVQLLAVATMAVCMLLLGLVVLVWTNAQGVVNSWGIDVPVTVYLADGANDEDIDRLAERVVALPEVDSVEGISPQMAMERLADGLGGDQSLLQGVDAGVLPASLEIELSPSAPADFAPALAERLEESEVVDEVAVAGAWVGKVSTMLDTLQLLAVGAGVLVSLACMAIVWSTIRLGVYARRAEIQILRLVGGTARFVRGPFVFEGMVQGALGASVALGLLYLGFDAIRPFMEGGLSLVFAAGSLEFFSPVGIGVGIGFGAAVGIAGSRAAVARYVEA